LISVNQKTEFLEVGQNHLTDKINLSLRIIQVPVIIRNKNGIAQSKRGGILIKRKNLVKPYLTINIPFVKKYQGFFRTDAFGVIVL
jgi:pantothenate synthetase